MADAEKRDVNGSPTDSVVHSEADPDPVRESDGEEQLDDAYDEGECYRCGSLVGPGEMRMFQG